GEPRGRAVDHVFWLTPGHPSEPGVWYAGTSPQGLFRSEDGGETWQGVDGFNDHPMQQAWVGGDQDATPDGPTLHSILVDPRVGDAMPRDVGDIGFPIALHPRDANTVWVCPMDGTEVWPRTSPGGRPALYVTRDAGASWQRQDRGFPAEQAWWTVKRQAMCTD